MDSNLENLIWQLTEKSDVWTIDFSRNGLSAKATLGSKSSEGYMSYEDFEDCSPVEALEDVINEALSGL